jgi:hypothetical protein
LATIGPPKRAQMLAVSPEGESVKDQIDCRSISGEYLRFSLFKEGRPLSPMAGNYVYIRGEDEKLEVVFVGEADNLSKHALAHFGEAQKAFGATALYTRLNITAAVRRREHAELLSAYEPPMNAEELRQAG